MGDSKSIICPICLKTLTFDAGTSSENDYVIKQKVFVFTFSGKPILILSAKLKTMKKLRRKE